MSILSFLKLVILWEKNSGLCVLILFCLFKRRSLSAISFERSYFVSEFGDQPLFHWTVDVFFWETSPFGCLHGEGKGIFKVAHCGAGSPLSDGEGGEPGGSGSGGRIAVGALAYWPCMSALPHRPTSGTRTMTDCCRPWRMETPRRWPRCWARRGPTPPSMTARARPRKLERLASDSRFWVLSLFSEVLRVPGELCKCI